jgi:hypothetical protein
MRSEGIGTLLRDRDKPCSSNSTNSNLALKTRTFLAKSNFTGGFALSLNDREEQEEDEPGLLRRGSAAPLPADKAASWPKLK